MHATQQALCSLTYITTRRFSHVFIIIVNFVKTVPYNNHLVILVIYLLKYPRYDLMITFLPSRNLSAVPMLETQ